MTSFMNPRSPVFRGWSAPRTQAIALPGLNAGTWSPAKLSKINGRRVLQMIPRLGRINPGWLIASVLADLALREATYYLTLVLNGLEFRQFCAPVPTAGFTGSPGGICLTNQATYQPMSELLQQVQSSSPGDYLTLVGFTGFAPFTTIPRYGSNSVYRVTGTAVAGVRARPYYAPQFPIVTWSRVATLAPPGRVPFDVRPWPTWKYGNPPIGPQPTPKDEDAPVVGGAVPGYRWSWSRFGAPPTVRTTSRTANPGRAIPRPMEREMKIGVNTAAGQFFFNLMKAREAVSEIEDIVGVMYSALPYQTRARYGGANASDHDKLRAMFENLEKMDAGLFLKGLIANQIEDEIIGRTWFTARGQIRNQVFGDTIGSLGPVANGAFEAYAKRVSDLAKGITDGMFGQQGYEYDRRLGELLKSTENALRHLRKLANQQRPRSRRNPAPE